MKTKDLKNYLNEFMSSNPNEENVELDEILNKFSKYCSEKEKEKRNCRASYEADGVLRIFPDSTGLLNRDGFIRMIKEIPVNHVVRKVVVEPGVYTGKDAEKLFSGCDIINASYKPEEFDLRNLDMTQTVSAAEMFFRNRYLVTVLFGQRTSPNLENVSSMFENCYYLKNVDFGGLTGTKVKDFSKIFDCCSRLETIDFKNMASKAVRNFEFAFIGCDKLKEVNLTNFDFCNLRSCHGMFTDCEILKKVEFGKRTHLSDVNMTGIFNNDSKLEEVDMKDFAFIVSVNDETLFGRYDSMFYGCSELKKLNLGSLTLHDFFLLPKSALKKVKNIETIILKDRVIALNKVVSDKSE